jgi:hypothetical protein
MEKRAHILGPEHKKGQSNPISRKDFFVYTGTTLASAMLLAYGCKKEEKDPPPADTGVNLGSGDTGILNYAYALEQLEAAFYIQVVSTPFSGITAAEQAILADIRDHEVAHRDFFKTALGSSAIGALEVNFSSIDFTNRNSVLSTAKAFEDLGVSAYNGAGKLLMDVNNLLLAGKIVSVEARHAAVIRDLLNPKSADYAGDDVVDASGLDVQRMPSDVLSIAAPYIKTKINASNLPTS